MTKRRRTPRRPGLDDKRYLASRERLKLIGNHHCNWCGWPIDMQLRYPHPLSWSCDHVVPRSQLAPHDYRHWHIDGLAEAHLRCNQARGDKPLPTRASPLPLDPSIDW
jgi:hypothetical protein